MNKEEFSALSLDDQAEYMNQELAAGKPYDTLLSELGLKRVDMVKKNFHYAQGKIVFFSSKARAMMQGQNNDTRID
jgi:hypothetical protein